MTIDEAFARLRTAFPSTAVFQGLHFKFAERDGVTLIERKREGRYFYWLIFEGKPVLIHASMSSKLAPMRTIGESLTVSPAAHD